MRERALKIVLALVGLFFTAAIYPAIGGIRDPVNSDMGDTMMMALISRSACSCCSLCEIRRHTAA